MTSKVSETSQFTHNFLPIPETTAKGITLVWTNLIITPNIKAYCSKLTVARNLGYFFINYLPNKSKQKAIIRAGIARSITIPPDSWSFLIGGAESNFSYICSLGIAFSSSVSLRVVRIISMFIGIGNLKFSKRKKCCMMKK